MNDYVRLSEGSNVIASADASVLYDYIGLRHSTSVSGERSSNRRQNVAKMLVDRVRIQSIRDHDLHLSVTPRINGRHETRVVAA